jgi:hypothetical protein
LSEGIANAKESTGDAALWRLAKRLHEKMDHLDPGDGVEWENLTPLERDYFYFSLKAVLLKRADVLRVLEVN